MKIAPILGSLLVAFIFASSAIAQEGEPTFTPRDAADALYNGNTEQERVDNAQEHRLQHIEKQEGPDARLRAEQQIRRGYP